MPDPKFYKVEDKVLVNTLTYLKARPYEEVVGLMNLLATSQEIKEEIKPNEKKPK